MGLRVLLMLVGIMVISSVMVAEARSGGSSLPEDLVLEGVNADDVREMLDDYDAIDQARQAGDFAAYRSAVSRAYFAQTHNIEADQGKPLDAKHFPNLSKMSTSGVGKLLAAVGGQNRGSLVYDTQPKALPGGSFAIYMRIFVREGGKWKFALDVWTGVGKCPSTAAEWRDLAQKNTYPQFESESPLRKPAEVSAGMAMYTVAKLIITVNGNVVADTRQKSVVGNETWNQGGLLAYGLQHGKNTIVLQYEPRQGDATFKTTIKIKPFSSDESPIYFEKEIPAQEKGTLQDQFMVEAEGVKQRCDVCEEPNANTAGQPTTTSARDLRYQEATMKLREISREFKRLADEPAPRSPKFVDPGRPVTSIMPSATLSATRPSHPDQK